MSRRKQFARQVCPRMHPSRMHRKLVYQWTADCCINLGFASIRMRFYCRRVFALHLYTGSKLHAWRGALCSASCLLGCRRVTSEDANSSLHRHRNRTKRLQPASNRLRSPASNSPQNVCDHERYGSSTKHVRRTE